jgi:ABC-type multidrug transport system fused ATPase/permease subunit
VLGLQVFAYVPDISSARGAAQEMIKLMDSEPEINGESEEGGSLTECKGLVELRDVKFRYRKYCCSSDCVEGQIRSDSLTCDVFNSYATFCSGASGSFDDYPSRVIYCYRGC